MPIICIHSLRCLFRYVSGRKKDYLKPAVCLCAITGILWRYEMISTIVTPISLFVWTYLVACLRRHRPQPRQAAHAAHPGAVRTLLVIRRLVVVVAEHPSQSAKITIIMSEASSWFKRGNWGAYNDHSAKETNRVRRNLPRPLHIRNQSQSHFSLDTRQASQYEGPDWLNGKK